MKKRLIPVVILIAYSAILIKVMVFKDVPLIRIGSLMINFGGTQVGPANLVPFKTILWYLLGEKGFVIAAINLVGNIVLLVPIGLLLPFAYRNITWRKTLAFAVAAGFAIEAMQVVLEVGIFDIDDVMLNALGVMVGYWSLTILAKRVLSMKSKNLMVTAVIVLIVAAVAGLYAVAVYQKSRLPVSFERRVESGESDRFEDKVSPTVDPCNGTGGTGQIVSVGNNTITIKLHDGSIVIINLTDKTTIKNSAGLASRSDLKTGDRVTVVVISNHTATAVFICNAGGSVSVI